LIGFLQVFVTHCPGWICRDNSSLGGYDTDSWKLHEADLHVVDQATLRRRNGKPKVQPHMFGRSHNNGVSLWDGTGVALRRDVKFRVNGSDVLVYLHIQKTGGTAFGKNMVTNLADPFSGRKSCLCKSTSKRWEFN
jgi:hypothetical protein